MDVFIYDNCYLVTCEGRGETETLYSQAQRYGYKKTSPNKLVSFGSAPFSKDVGLKNKTELICLS